jgi:hypothetical protein
MTDNKNIYKKWYEENESRIHQSHGDVESVAYEAFVAGAKAMETLMEKHFDSSNNKKNFVKKHFWDLVL